MVLVSLREAIHPNLPNVLKNISPDISSNLGCRPRLESHYISGWADVRANVLLSAPIIEGRATSVMRSGLIQECQNICWVEIYFLQVWWQFWNFSESISMIISVKLFWSKNRHFHSLGAVFEAKNSWKWLSYLSEYWIRKATFIDNIFKERPSWWSHSWPNNVFISLPK